MNDIDEGEKWKIDDDVQPPDEPSNEENGEQKTDDEQI
jgi:hypothetical protein